MVNEAAYVKTVKICKCFNLQQKISLIQSITIQAFIK